MSFDAYLIGIITFLVLFVPFISVYCFMRGYSLGVKDWNSHNPDEPKAEPATKQKHFPSAPDQNLQRYADILENIENYDGTGANQKEIS